MGHVSCASETTALQHSNVCSCSQYQLNLLDEPKVAMMRLGHLGLRSRLHFSTRMTSQLLAVSKGGVVNAKGDPASSW